MSMAAFPLRALFKPLKVKVPASFWIAPENPVELPPIVKPELVWIFNCPVPDRLPFKALPFTNGFINPPLLPIVTDRFVVRAAVETRSPPPSINMLFDTSPNATSPTVVRSSPASTFTPPAAVNVLVPDSVTIPFPVLLKEVAVPDKTLEIVCPIPKLVGVIPFDRIAFSVNGDPADKLIDVPPDSV
jgi:hypothetical protein